MNLVEIGKKYPSSKNISGFIQLYEKYFEPFRNLEINILEIGIENGDSLRIWREYFTKANMSKLHNIGYKRSFANLEDGVKDYVQNYLLARRYL